MLDGTHAEVVAAAIMASYNENIDALVPVQLDACTFALPILDYDHYEIHAGSSFHCWYEQTVSDIGDETIIAFKTSNTAKYLHMFAHFLSTAAAEARLLEAPTITDNTGASLAVYNRDRNSAVASGVIDTSQSPDVANQATYFTEATQGNVTGGTEITHWHLQADSGNKPAGGEARALNELMLKPDTLYAFVIESLTDEDNTCEVRLNWYEHTSKS